jgi:hypothetical protein
LLAEMRQSRPVATETKKGRLGGRPFWIQNWEDQSAEVI